MQTTMMPCRTGGSQRPDDRPRYPDDMAIFVKRFAPRGRDPAVADENLYRYCENEPTDGVDPSGKELLYLGVSSGKTPDPDDVNLQQDIQANNSSELCQFVQDLYKVSDEWFTDLQNKGKVTIDGKVVKDLTKEQLIARAEHEQCSQVIVQTSGGLKGATDELMDLGNSFGEHYDYDRLAIGVHAMPGMMFLDGDAVTSEEATPKLEAAAKGCAAKFVIYSCFNNPTGQSETVQVILAKGKVEWYGRWARGTATGLVDTWIPNKNREPCSITFTPYKVQKKVGKGIFTNQ